MERWQFLINLTKENNIQRKKNRRKMNMSKNSRRKFLHTMGLGTLAIAGLNCKQDLSDKKPNGEKSMNNKTLKEFVELVRYRKEEVDEFLDDSLPNWGKFDKELGYTVRTFKRRDGIDGSNTIHSLAKNGIQRKQINYADEPCRINTYGDSFTMCSQCNDGETWQEYLAAHFREPVRNFGIGGYGVYQAYRRMRRVEKTDLAAKYHILNIFSDDNYRNLDLARWVRNAKMREKIRDGKFNMIHANPWCHLRWNTNTMTFDEIENPCNTQELLYKFCDSDFVYNLLEHDFMTQIALARSGYKVNDTKYLQEISDNLNLKFDFSDANNCLEECNKLAWILAQKSSLHTVDLHKKYCEENNKKLIVCTSYTLGEVEKACFGKPRNDSVLFDGLQSCGLPFVDGLEIHKKDYENFSCSPADYAKRFYVGHYAPQGNFFYASALKNTLVELLNPKPASYESDLKSSLGVEKQLL